jgi:hypothetical protein
MAQRLYVVGSSASVDMPSSNRYPEHLVKASSSEVTAMELVDAEAAPVASDAEAAGSLPKRGCAGLKKKHLERREGLGIRIGVG